MRGMSAADRSMHRFSVAIWLPALQILSMFYYDGARLYIFHFAVASANRGSIHENQGVGGWRGGVCGC